MKQLLQSLNDGSTELVDVPAPKATVGSNLIRTSVTLVSAGTERMIIEFGKGNLIQKARSHPDKVKMVLEKVKTDGVLATFDAVKSKLDQPVALGYCNVGTIIQANANGYVNGDRVVSNGNHAEVVSVPKNLCAKIPSNVTDEAASFTVLAAIGLQGIRLAKPTLGESIVVVGLGLIGLLTVQMLRAHGCRVLGVDLDSTRLELARKFGAETVDISSGEDLPTKANTFSKGAGVDGVLLTASTDSNELISQAAKICRQRGRIVLVGVVGMELNRSDFYEKELTFQVSCSYGPGRYDHNYEDQGIDYPIGLVRWTEQRNFEAVLEMMSTGALDVAPLITHRFELIDGKKAMDLLTSRDHALGILLNFGSECQSIEKKRSVALSVDKKNLFQPTKGVVTFLGAGNYAGRTLIPAFKDAGAYLHTIISSGGVSAVHFGKKFGFQHAYSDYSLALEEDSVDTIVIATRHNTHAQQVLAALRADKHVFCEKPLCLTLEELDEIEQEAILRPHLKLCVGFNRRFAPHTKLVKSLLSQVNLPKSFVFTVNAGSIPKQHWTQVKDLGGGRIVGEVCHYLDLLRHLAGCPISDWHAVCMDNHPSLDISNDKAIISLKFEDGSIGVINYLANGHNKISKERLEIFVDGRALMLDNFIKLKGYGWKNFTNSRLWKQDKGQNMCSREFLNAVTSGGNAPIPLCEVVETSRLSIQIGDFLL